MGTNIALATARNLAGGALLMTLTLTVRAREFNSN
ncbi:hypothetical protein H4W27_000087 [Nesterenkonia lutea]|uniref:Uncharacterized protein n=1 Tax=Nesterenkonia lutea TaxID=272919 RepID=A0ABR9JAL7_9MICC|nr:hypothetical protein [Nesterenkonia lutea]